MNGVGSIIDMLLIPLGTTFSGVVGFRHKLCAALEILITIDFLLGIWFISN